MKSQYSNASCTYHLIYYVINSRQMIKNDKADDRGEPGRESRRFDFLQNSWTATFGWFIFDFHFLRLFPSKSLTFDNYQYFD